MIEREMNLGQLAEALNDAAQEENRKARAAGAVAYAPPAVRREHEVAQAKSANGRPPQLEWPASEVPRPELERAPETPTIVHEASTDLAHTFEACAVQIERERDQMVAETAKVAEQATEAAAVIRGMKDKAVAAVVDQTTAARKLSTQIVAMIKEFTP